MMSFNRDVVNSEGGGVVSPGGGGGVAPGGCRCLLLCGLN
jgi:hypothetical protein